MELFLNILGDTLNALFLYTATAFAIVFLHCFHDSGFQWTAKKAILLAVYTLIGAVF